MCVVFTGIVAIVALVWLLDWATKRDNAALERQLRLVVRGMKRLGTKEGMQMAAIDDLRTEVEATKGVTASAIVLINGLADKLDEVIESGNVDPALAAIVAELRTTNENLAAAVAANPVPEPGAPPA